MLPNPTMKSHFLHQFCEIFFPQANIIFRAKIKAYYAFISCLVDFLKGIVTSPNTVTFYHRIETFLHSQFFDPYISDLDYTTQKPVIHFCSENLITISSHSHLLINCDLKVTIANSESKVTVQ